ncbi:MAG: response regulator [Firmicutes bacterium]|nr:response regulator [Bacillota bacterium]
MEGGRAPVEERNQGGWALVVERTQGGCALVVERTRFLREKLVSLLGRAGWQVEGTAREGGAALELARRYRPDLVVLDLVLPDMPGTELIRAIKAELPGCRVVVCSALVQSRWVKAAVEAGADDFVIKPVDEARFLAAVEGDLARPPAPQRQALDEGA